MRVALKNELIAAEIDTHGAELKTVKRDGREYMWHADPSYWGRTSPVLFPFVGALRGGEYRYDSKSYAMGQHGFARDMDFEIVAANDSLATFALASTPDSRERFPFDFTLIISYSLEGDTITVMWRVINPSARSLPFSIGAHPAFMVKLDDDGTFCGNYLKFDRAGSFVATDFADDLVQSATHSVATDADGYFPLDAHTFDNGVHILKNHQVHEVALADSNRQPYITVGFDAPIVGIWSPPGKKAPFLCIEPWYGLADAADFEGELSDRPYSQTLALGESFAAEYHISFG